MGEGARSVGECNVRAARDAARPTAPDASPEIGAFLVACNASMGRIDATAKRVLGATWVLLPVALIALPALPWVLDGTHRASLTTLGRDQGIFQYVAWAIGKGEVAYRDVRDVNGPLTPLVHLALLALGGRDEHRFRVLDLAITGLSFALTGACLPGIGRGVPGRRSALSEGAPRLERALARLGWAGAAWVALSGQLLMYLYWDLGQRETFANWFLLPAVGLQLVAHDALRASRRLGGGALVAQRRRGAWLLAVSMGLGAVPWSCKPTYALFTAAQALTLVVDDDLVLERRARVVVCGAGVLAGLALPLAFLVGWGDLRAFLRILAVDVPGMYRFMMPRTPSEILSLRWGGPPAALAGATGLGMIALILDGQMPRRALAIALLPLCGVAGVIAQAKGFPYHFHPVTAGLVLQWLTLAAWAWERFARAPGRLLVRLVPIAAAVALGARLSTQLLQSPHVLATWIVEKGATAELRESRDYLVTFRDRDFFPVELRQGAAYLRAHTRPTDRVQTYGMDPYLLFLAERLSATPYIYVYDLDADGALAGSWMTQGGLHPTAEQAAFIRALRDEHERDLLERVRRAPPAAWVFVDKAPLMTFEDAVYDFHVHCPDAARWFDEHYREAESFGEVHVWLRSDLAPPNAPK